MPSATVDFTVQKYESTHAIPGTVWNTLRGYARDANVLLPNLEKINALERSSGRFVPGQLWITCTTVHPNAPPSVDFVLGCTDGALGPYPIFIVSTLSHQISFDALRCRLRSMAYTLHLSVPSSRVYSIFAQETITRLFATNWTEFTSIPLAPSPEYYAARITYCTKATYKDRHMPLPGLGVELRLATPADAHQVADLCHGFAAESEPFTLTEEGALREANLLFHSGQVWVHVMHDLDQGFQIASIVAVTRSSDRVATITKVYTSPRWRKMGCAERLTRSVVAHLLQFKESVVLYVANANPAAAKVYSRVGFVGLDEESQSKPVAGVDRWLELGFDRKYVRLGHW
ncbi:hypothetical protein BXZ70DRAFT_929052 [Cristinia sonorae]|uniref:N-acetyltransferase domain-containing protein n=1 Tax=Cristinia sonorae TaxID=1940300 RepID=A0A8K0UT41_9AGAR|nr:hypothetical protein BXZ70DRAFT_929052 [Cristinia sonorae]